MRQSSARWPVPFLLVALAVPLPLQAQKAAAAYEVVHGWPDLPAGEVLGQATGVAVSSKGEVLVFHRANRTWVEPFPADPIDRPTIAVFDGKSGRFLRSWGAGTFIMPHSITVDRKDNVWLTDVARQQVLEFSSDGRLLLTVGEKGVAGNDRTHFDRPTDVAVLADGSFYVSDGYRNTRVVRFAADGTYLFEWGTKGSGPGQFDLPHSLAVDAEQRVYVADRSNSRIQVFDSVGHFQAEWKDARIGRPFALTVHGDRVFAADGGDQPKAPPDRGGVAVLDRTGRVITSFGRYGNYDGQFRVAHDIAVGADGAVYVADALGQRVQKFVLARH
ncbi:MAG: peptidyl-alpha-hydroxyglycine alpha-amidating lyase family protein [Gemmatimonadota bacterium]